ncbi:ead/Ea22-like family protein [Klebsiella quasipneumoniae]|uniref:ead/Ea22-like family protein n=1 Tax=Klebsiella quasipneumoniae TaxID=1463165 RepID=UPI001FB6187C|nr:ead/Ea22-like family protein [Klebsiella quasipneumoniae]
MTTDITELTQSKSLRKKLNRRLNDAYGFQRTSGGKHTTISLSIAECKSVIAALEKHLALVEALEKAQQVDEELCKLLPPGAEYMDPPDGGDVTPLEGVRRMVADYRQRIAELEAQNEYIRKRYQQLDLLIGKNILAMQAAIIEWQATGDAKNGLAWIYNTLFGPGELPDEAEKDAQAYFDRKYAPLDEELMALHKWFWEQSEAERAAAGIKLEAE